VPIDESIVVEHCCLIGSVLGVEAEEIQIQWLQARRGSCHWRLSAVPSLRCFNSRLAPDVKKYKGTWK